MEFKVGDRVWTIDPPINLEESDPQEKGPGRVLEINPRPFTGAYLVKLDSGKEWAYWETSLRHLLATPTPSITVGTQVRLTGVVTEIDSDGDIWIKIPDSISAQSYVILSSEATIEVIRQPFKRGEVLVEVCSDQKYVVVEDETNGFVCVGNRQSGLFDAEPSRFERRP